MINFVNILGVHFLHKSALRSFFLVTCKKRKAAEKTFVQKGAHKMLMKLTPVYQYVKTQLGQVDMGLLGKMI